MNKINKIDLVQFFTILPIVIICFGALELSLYYLFFNIQIGQFLRIQDILNLFLTDVIFYGVLIVFFYIILILTFDESASLKKHERILATLSSNSFRERYNLLYRDAGWFLYPVFILGLVSLAIPIFVPELSRILLPLGIEFVLVSLFPLVFFELERKILQMNRKEYNGYAHNIMLAVFGLLVIMILKVNYKIVEVKNLKYYGTQVVTKENTYVSDSSTNYLGKTLNFYFFYNIDDKSKIIIPSEDVDKLILKEKPLRWYNSEIQNVISKKLNN